MSPFFGQSLLGSLFLCAGRTATVPGSVKLNTTRAFSGLPRKAIEAIRGCASTRTRSRPVCARRWDHQKVAPKQVFFGNGLARLREQPETVQFPDVT